MVQRLNFKPALLVIAFVFLFFWGTSLVKVISTPEAHFRLPSSYDLQADVPIPQQISEATTPYLLVDFYQDACVVCQRLAPLLHELRFEKKVKACLTFIPINTERAENRLFVDLFKVETVPALFIFQPSAMKKTPVEIQSRLQQKPLFTVKELKQIINTSLKQQDAKPACSL